RHPGRGPGRRDDGCAGDHPGEGDGRAAQSQQGRVGEVGQLSDHGQGSAGRGGWFRGRADSANADVWSVNWRFGGRIGRPPLSHRRGVPMSVSKIPHVAGGVLIATAAACMLAFTAASPAAAQDAPCPPGGGTDAGIEHGVDNSTCAAGALAYGSDNLPGSSVALVAGRDNVTGNGAAVGLSNEALGTTSTAMGIHNSVTSWGGLALGNNNTASSLEYAAAVGRYNTASGVWSTAFGQGNTASGYLATAMGLFNTASGALGSAIG